MVILCILCCGINYEPMGAKYGTHWLKSDMVESQKDRDGNLIAYTNHKFEQIWNNFEYKALTTSMMTILD